MLRSLRTSSVRPGNTERRVPPGFRRDRLAILLGLATIVCLGLAFLVAQDVEFLMPGPLASAHSAIVNCSACHTKSGRGKLSWIHRLVADNPLADSKACLTCHKMPDTALNAHSASAEVLKQSTERLKKIAEATPAPLWARTQSIAFPTHEMVARGLSCAACHQEHKGVNVNLSKTSNEQCHSCHSVKFDSFEGHHPEFENYPFKRRPRIIYDHARHFAKHFPEVAKKNPATRIPATCSACHNNHEDKRVMAVAPFEQTCSACHLEQIIGKERVSGPKGIAFLTLPGLDLRTLKEKNAPIGEWPDASEAELTPFMRVMISRHERGRALIKTVDGLNLQDLANASDDQIKAVTNLVWEIKSLFYALISRKASDVLADLDIGTGAKLSATLVADLTANIPRDVVISAQREWLPNLATEIANGPVATDQTENSWNTAITVTGAASPVEPPGSDAPRAGLNPEDSNSETSSIAKLDPPVCTVRVFGQCLLSKEREDEDDADKESAGKPDTASADAGEKTSSADEQPLGAEPEASAGKPDTASSDADGGAATPSFGEPPLATRPEASAGKPDTASTDADGAETPSAGSTPQSKAADQTDDLLSPTADELRAIKAAENAARSNGVAGAAGAADSNSAAAEPQVGAALATSIDSDVDPESWAEAGGWYRQDDAIFYRPTGHKDKFIYSWLLLTGSQAPKGATSPAASVFDFLTGKDAQGSCTKCHSVDAVQGKGRAVNFSFLSIDTAQGGFTNFNHEPHFQAIGIGQRIGILENRGCLTCHNLEKEGPYLKSYEQGNPLDFVPNFGAIKKDLCQTCHNSSTARQDCLLCHKYHVNGVDTPIMNTLLPGQ